MGRVYQSFPVNDIELLKQQMLTWSSQFDICCFLDNHGYQSTLHTHECLLAVGYINVFNPGSDFFSSLSVFNELNDDWIFGHFNYDLKNRIEDGLSSSHPDNISFPECFLFVPRIMMQLKSNVLIIGVINDNARQIFEDITKLQLRHHALEQVNISSRISRGDYISIISALLNHLHHGDCYEINFCQEFYANASINPLAVYNKLSLVSPSPFSAFYKLNEKYLMCSSPERYIKKTGNTIISQPIKGTARRSADDKIDKRLRQQLLLSKKDRSENVMVVDLVRNDLSKISVAGTVGVTELFGVYSFPNLHQMISTVSGELKPDLNISDVLKATFPMGSMTGAPKRRVMELIEKYERTKRGIYSGTIGYISPEKDFDFNVVIRSIMYNQATDYLSFQVGSAITSYSKPEEEYEECLLKSKAIIEVFTT